MRYLSSIDLHYTAHVVPVLTYDFDVQVCKTFITTAAISCFYLIRPCHQCYFIDMLNNIFSSVIGYRITENDNIRIMQKTKTTNIRRPYQQLENVLLRNWDSTAKLIAKIK